MLLSVPSNLLIFVVRGAVDVRKSFDGLSLIVQHECRQEAFSGDRFVFFKLRADAAARLASSQRQLAVVVVGLKFNR